MKKMIKPAVREESELICDVTGKPAVARLIMTFGYGSGRDSDLLRLDLADEVAEEVVAYLKAKYPNLQYQERGEFEWGCPLCHRR
jgi:hypothetical protein